MILAPFRGRGSILVSNPPSCLIELSSLFLPLVFPHTLPLNLGLSATAFSFGFFPFFTGVVDLSEPGHPLIRYRLMVLRLAFNPIQSVRFVARDQIGDVVLTYDDYVSGDIRNGMNPLRINQKNLGKIIWIDLHLYMP